MKSKRKSGSQEAVVPRAILENAKLAADTDKLQRPSKCRVCGTECAPNSTEGLCWVCRRLKISAWRDNDTQMAMQE